MRCSLPLLVVLVLFESLFSSLVFAQDKIFVKGSNPVVGGISKVDDTSIYIQLHGAGAISISRANIDKVEVAHQPGMESGLKAFEASKMPNAVRDLEPIYLKYRGLPDPLIEKISARLGDAYLGVKEWNKAKEVFLALKKFYPKGDYIDIAISGEAQALLELGQSENATKTLESFVAEREKLISVNDEQNRALGKAFVALGKCYRAGNKEDQAQEAFLKTTTLYFMDSTATAEALYQSALLFEKQNNTSRAQDQLEELLKNFPSFSLASEAQKKIESLKLVNKTQEPKQ
jgi:tetratricopeptide (TPR) repeat protein